jgi:hypothetical protein
MFIGRELLCFTSSNWRILKRYNIFPHLCLKPTCDTMASSALSRALHILTASTVYNTPTQPLLALSQPLLALSCPLLALSLLWPPLYTLTASTSTLLPLHQSQGLYWHTCTSTLLASTSTLLMASMSPFDFYNHYLTSSPHSHGFYNNHTASVGTLITSTLVYSHSHSLYLHSHLHCH